MVFLKISACAAPAPRRKRALALLAALVLPALLGACAAAQPGPASRNVSATVYGLDSPGRNLPGQGASGVLGSVYSADSPSFSRNW